MNLIDLAIFFYCRIGRFATRIEKQIHWNKEAILISMSIFPFTKNDSQITNSIVTNMQYGQCFNRQNEKIAMIKSINSDAFIIHWFKMSRGFEKINSWFVVDLFFWHVFYFTRPKKKRSVACNLLRVIKIPDKTRARYPR